MARHAQEQINYARAAADAARKQLAVDKEAAWSHAFKATDDCVEPANWKTQVECGNEYMRTKKEFEDNWAKAHPPEESAAPSAVVPTG